MQTWKLLNKSTRVAAGLLQMRTTTAMDAFWARVVQQSLNAMFMNGSEKSSKLRAMKWLVVLLAEAALLLGGPSVASAQKVDSQSVRQAVQAGKARPLSEILARIQSEYGGRVKVVDVDLEHDSSGRQWYEITILTREGQRVAVYVDVVTGQDIPNPRQRPTHMVSMAEVVRRVQADYTGVIREVELEEAEGGRLVYKVALRLPDGREQRLQVDAVTGQTTRGDARHHVQSSKVQLHELIETMEQRYGGQAQELETKVTLQGRLYYELELQLPDGRSLEINVDAMEGHVLREEELN